ncbi:MAG: cephalosporin hydroxylase [Okeania sp. SIO3H1]|nr:cephalosporin hydroxylase [Okeania sp. SIO3H1]
MSYQNVVKQAKHLQEPLKENRFVKISEREDRSDIPVVAWQPLLNNSYLQTWKGMILAKGVTEIAVYPMLLHELQPKTIIEIGAFNGGAAIWMADLLNMFDIDSSIYSVDIDISLIDEKAKLDSRVNFLQGDCNKLSEVFPPEKLAEFPHPWLVIEDAHINLIAVANYFHNNGLKKGDYLIFEDTNKYMWEAWGDNWDDQEEMEKGSQKMDELRSWLENYENEYLIDSYYQDMYGYNGSKNWNSILKKF